MWKLRFCVHYLFILPHILIFLLINRKTKQLIKSDIAASNRHKGLHSLAYYLIFFPSFRSLFYYRINKVSILLRWYYPGERNFYIATNLGGHAYVLSHPYGTILNAKSIGHHFNCKHLTTIGNKQDNRNDLRPSIGNNVTLGANVTIIGDIEIGDNVIIGAGAVVVKNVPNNCIVAGNPAKIISKNHI